MRNHDDRRPGPAESRNSGPLSRRFAVSRNARRHIDGWFRMYCKETSLHGFRYITEAGSTIIESILWSVVCVSSIVFCMVLMLRLWANYSKNPISTTIDTSNLIWDLPFPGVTICNNNKIYRPHAEIIAEQLRAGGVNDTERFFNSLLRLVRPDKFTIDDATALRAFRILGITVEKLMKKLMQPCGALLLRCAWIGQIYDCGKIFKTVKSKEGFCCAFNFHYGLSTGLSDQSDQPETPGNTTALNDTVEYLPGVDKILNAPGSGRDVGLTVALNIDRRNYKGSVRPSVGASIFIHDAIDFPDIGAHIASVTPGHVLAISVSGISITSTDSMRDLPPDRRMCYFDDEVIANGDSRYSYQTCVSECVAKQLQKYCGCLPFYYPEKYTGVRTCYLTDVQCILDSRRKLSDEPIISSGVCDKCLPQCSDIRYNIDMEDVKMDTIHYESEFTNDLDLENNSVVYVFFGDISYVKYSKENILSWDALLASFGGIFGLCLGGSVMSAIELLYLLARELFKQRRAQRRADVRNLPPATEMFRQMPAENTKSLRTSQNHQEFEDRRVYVTWYQPPLHSQRLIDFEDARRKRVKF